MELAERAAWAGASARRRDSLPASRANSLSASRMVVAVDPTACRDALSFPSQRIISTVADSQPLTFPMTLRGLGLQPLALIKQFDIASLDAEVTVRSANEEKSGCCAPKFATLRIPTDGCPVGRLGMERPNFDRNSAAAYGVSRHINPVFNYHARYADHTHSKP